MKKLLPLIFLITLVRVHAQTQELKQLSLNIEKLAQLKMMLSQAYQGYTILESGYRQITDISEGNYSLHKDFLDGMLRISPAVRNYKKVADIVAINVAVTKEYKTNFDRLRQLSVFNFQELDAIARDYGQLVSRSADGLNELYTILTPWSLRMSDVERIQAIDQLAAFMQKQLSALRRYNQQLSGLSAIRLQAKRDIQQIKQLF